MTNAFERIGKYLKSREVHPMKQLGDGIHVVQVGSEWEAELLLSDLREFHNSHASLVEEVERLREVIRVTRSLVSEAAMTGFRWDDGDWAERLFANQRELSKALEKANA